MASLLEAIDIKRKMFFEFEDAPYHCLDRDVSTPTARGGQTLVRLKMRNLITGAVFDKTFKAGDKFKEPDLVSVPATFLYADGTGYHFMDQETFDTLTLSAAKVGDGRDLLVDNVLVDIQKYNGNPIGLEFPPHVELTVTVDRAGRPRRHGERRRHQGGDARDRARDPRAALHQGGREGEGAHGDAGVRGESVDQRPNPNLQLPRHSQAPTPNHCGDGRWAVGSCIGLWELGVPWKLELGALGVDEERLMTTRRDFITTVATTAAGLTIVPRHVLGRGFQAPSDTVNVAAVGIGGMGAVNTQGGDEPERRRDLRLRSEPARRQAGGVGQGLAGGAAAAPAARRAAAQARRRRQRLQVLGTVEGPARRRREVARPGRSRQPAALRPGSSSRA